MKDYKQVVVGLALVALLAVGIALSQPKPAQAEDTKADDLARKQDVTPAPAPEVADAAEEPKSEEPAAPEVTEPTEDPAPADGADPILALIDMVDEPAGKVRVLTSLAVTRLKAEQDPAAILETLLKQFDALPSDAAKLEALGQVTKDLSEFEGNESLTAFNESVLKLEQALNPAPYHAEKLAGLIEAPAMRVKVLSQFATALAGANQSSHSVALLDQAAAIADAIEAAPDQFAARTVLALAQLQTGQTEAATTQLDAVLSAISELESDEDQLAAYNQLAKELESHADHELVGPKFKSVNAAALKLKYQADPVLRLVSGVEDAGGRVRVLCNLAGTLALTGDPEQSALMLTKAQEIVDTLDAPGELAPALTHLATSQSLIGQADAAKATLAKAMEMVDGIESVDEQAAALSALVSAVESMDKAEHMETVLAQSLKTANAIQQRAQAVMQQSLKLINRLPAGEQKAAAIKQIAEAMEQGGAGQFTELQFELATLHHEGRHLPKDLQRAIAWYRKAAGEGHAEAQLNLAVMLLEGEGMEPNPEEAISLLSAAAEQGHAEGQVALGMLLALGQGVEADLVEAHKWVTLSSKSGNDDATAALEQLAPKLTPDQIAQSAKRVEEWEAKQAPATPEPAPTPAPATEPAPAEPATKEAEPTKTAGK